MAQERPTTSPQQPQPGEVAAFDAVILPVSLGQEIARYLLGRPMAEVEALVNGLRQCEPHRPERQDE